MAAPGIVRSLVLASLFSIGRAMCWGLFPVGWITVVVIVFLSLFPAF